MRVPPADRPLDEDEWRAFVADQSFGHLVAPGQGRALPVVVATPYLLEGDEVVAHVARGNPVLAALEERPVAMLCVAGDATFIPSAWKAVGGEDPRTGIPTTYYAAVQLAGPAELVEGPGELTALLRRQLDWFQPGLDVADPEAEHAGRLAQICGIVVHVEAVEARFKYGGNVDVAPRRHVLEQLAARDLPRDRLALEHLRRRVGDGAEPTAFRRGSP